jgi:hypothetical protein
MPVKGGYIIRRIFLISNNLSALPKTGNIPKHHNLSAVGITPTDTQRRHVDNYLLQGSLGFPRTHPYLTHAWKERVADSGTRRR